MVRSDEMPKVRERTTRLRRGTTRHHSTFWNECCLSMRSRGEGEAMKEASYNCPSCRYNCAPDIKDYFTANQTKHCDWHEDKVGGEKSVH